MKYFLAFERTDGSMDKPFLPLANKKKAITMARRLAKIPSFDCTRIWVEDCDRCGLEKFSLPEWKA